MMPSKTLKSRDCNIENLFLIRMKDSEISYFNTKFITLTGFGTDGPSDIAPLPPRDAAPLVL